MREGEPSSGDGPHGESGQATVMVLAVVVMAVVVLFATATFSARVVAREQAQVAADAAALAGVSGGRAEAQRMAAANGAVLTGFVSAGETVVVSVVVGSESATASATRAP